MGQIADGSTQHVCLDMYLEVRMEVCLCVQLRVGRPGKNDLGRGFCSAALHVPGLVNWQDREGNAPIS